MLTSLHRALRLVLPTMVLLLCGCQDGGPGRQSRPTRGVGAMLLRGSGASFPMAILSKWSLRYFARTGLKLDYTPTNSTAGIAAIRSGKVDFAASEVPLTPEQLEQDQLCQFPVVLGAVVPVFNIPGFRAGELRLSADALAGIYLGQIKRWNHPLLRTLNPGRTLPGAAIIPVFRPEEAGATSVFTRYLAHASARWRRDAVEPDRARLRVGVQAKGNAQVVKFVKQFKHTLGYAPHTDVSESGLAWARLRNREGQLASPRLEALKAAADHGTWRTDPEVRPRLIDATGEQSWPITGASYILLRRQQRHARRTGRLLHFFRWALSAGSDMARRLGYAPIPARFIPHIERQWQAQLSAQGAPVWCAGQPSCAAPAHAAQGGPHSQPTSRPSPHPASRPTEPTTSPAAPARAPRRSPPTGG